MRVLIFEPRHKGHHFYYVQRMIPALLDSGCEVVVVTERAAAASPEYSEHLLPLREKITLAADLQPVPAASFQHFRARLAQFRHAVLRQNPAHVLVPTADGLAPMLGAARMAGIRCLPRQTELELNLLRCSFAYGGSNRKHRAKLWAVRRAIEASPAKVLHTIDAVAFESILRRGGGLALRMRLLPDTMDQPVPQPKAQARATLALPAGRYVGAAGVIDERKGIFHLVRAFSAAGLPPTDRLLLAGKCDAATEDRLRREFRELYESGRLVLLNRYLTAAEFDAAIAAMDVVCAPYVDHLGPSAVVMRAMAAGRPVVAADYGWCGTIIPRFGLGSTANVRDAQAFADAIRQSLMRAAEYKRTPAADRLLRFISPDNFGACWAARIRERLNLPPLPIYPWAAVAPETAG